MANTQNLTRRIKTASNIRQITKAMEMVSASKMRRAQAQALSSRPYARNLFNTLQTISHLTNSSVHPLLETHKEGTDIVILVSTDKSLAGSLNTNLFRQAYEYLTALNLKNSQAIIIGQKARYFANTNDIPLYAEFINLPDPIRFQDVLPLSDLIINHYINLNFKSVHLIYMDFVSTLVQRFHAKVILPFSISWEEFADTPAKAIDSIVPEKTTYVFEPNAKSILNWLLPYYLELTLYQTLLEARASEHSARMVAMKNASENAQEIIADLTLDYNKQRQAKITGELLDNITSSLIIN